MERHFKQQAIYLQIPNKQEPIYLLKKYSSLTIFVQCNIVHYIV